MKSLQIIIVSLGLLIVGSNYAQVNVNVNIGTTPSWGPVGYSKAEYYYLPDVDLYYDVPASQFIYFGNGKWVRSRYLPRAHRNYNLHKGYKVVLTDYHGRTPYKYHKSHKVKYYKGYKGGPQKTIVSRKGYVHKSKHSPKKQNWKHNEKGHKNQKH